MEDFLKTLAELTALNTGTSSVVAVKTVFTSNEPPAALNRDALHPQCRFTHRTEHKPRNCR